ncbi:LppK protein [Mycolicibacterium vulneris]|nr:LppK protein [Mycolicibacterium vulneris]
MNHSRIAVLSAATIVAALGLCGCSSPDHPASSSHPKTSALTTTAPAAPPAAPLPAPEALTGVLDRLADVNVPGADKVVLVEQGTADDAAALDKFGKALADNGFTPLTFEATDLAWSQTEPANVVATVKVTSGGDGSARDFSFPMEFTPHGDGWQLTRHTADLLLVMGPFSETSAPPAPTPPR